MFYPYYGSYNVPGYSVYLLLLIPVMALSLWAQTKVQGNFKKFSRVANRRGMTGAQAADAVLRANGITNVAIRSCSGQLTDHYDPRNNTISLSQGVYNASTIAAVGVAAHEAGHAVQYAVGYFPIKIRNLAVPVTQFGSKFSIIFLMIGMLLYSQSMFFIGLILFSFTTIFQLITLPVEFNASRRALQTLENANILDTSELPGARKVLSAAALTYVAALLMSALQLLRYVLIFMGRSNRRNN